MAIAPMSIKVWVAQIINWLSGLKQHEYFSESSCISSYELSILSQIVCKVTPNVLDLVFSVVIDDSAETNLDVKSLTEKIIITRDHPRGIWNQYSHYIYLDDCLDNLTCYLTGCRQTFKCRYSYFQCTIRYLRSNDIGPHCIHI